MKFYAVKNGRAPGIYTTWGECQSQVNGFSGAIFKSFSTRQEAENFMRPSENYSGQEGTLEIFTDGSFMNGRAGGAAYCPVDKKALLQSCPGNHTNNRGELLAILLAIQGWPNNTLHIRSDSQISINVLANGYAAKENLDLIAQIRQAMKGRRISFEYVEAHAGIEGNEKVDALAKAACDLESPHYTIRQVE